MAAVCFGGARYDQAVEWARQSLEYHPNDAFNQALLIASLGHAERSGEAREAVERMAPLSPDRLRLFLASTPDYADRVIAGLRKAGWRG